MHSHEFWYGTDCAFIHDNIDMLYGVDPGDYDKLPMVCSCGAPITYANTVAFINLIHHPNPNPTTLVVNGVVDRSGE